MEKLSNQLQFKVPKKFGSNIYKYKNMNITIEKIRSIKKLNSNRKRNTIFGVLDGGLVDKKKRYVLSAGDIVRTDTVKKLCKVFKINKKIIIYCSKNA